MTAGIKLDTGASISTGFSSTALLDLGTSTLKVAPLTRMQLVELIARQGSVSTTLALKVGKVNAEVKSAQGLRQDFTLKGPQATAAVRGTEFEFDGVSVKVINGLVFFTNTQGQGRGVGAGEQSSTNGTRLPTSGDQENESNTSVNRTPPRGGRAFPRRRCPGVRHRDDQVAVEGIREKSMRAHTSKASSAKLAAVVMLGAASLLFTGCFYVPGVSGGGSARAGIGLPRS